VVSGWPPVTVHLDTSILIDAFVPNGASKEALRRLMRTGDKVTSSTIVLFEWLRGPRTPEEVRLREAVLPDERIVWFGLEEATRAAELYRTVRRPRGREADLAIAACAIVRGAALWTLNAADFEDVPGLALYGR
jgi:predicted nucleic acid-binding protein